MGSLKGSGPALVKGGPGTGKSTIALYRVKEIIASLLREGINSPRLLFTTYTNALVRSSEQQLKQLLGDKIKFVEVSTVDKLVATILRQANEQVEYVKQEKLPLIWQEARREAIKRFEGNALEKLAQRESLNRLGDSYLQEEILGVIVGRQLSTLPDYLKASRSGRRVPLNSLQRQAIWKVAQCFNEALNKRNLLTFPHARDLAQNLLQNNQIIAPYDAVIVDEAQDMEPSILRILVCLCKDTGRLFLTADANQSIYGSGFSWSDIHTVLRFTGRTSVLKSNYRSTREIGEAAYSYLQNDLLDEEKTWGEYLNTGPLPVVRAVENVNDEGQLLARFFPRAAREFRLGLNSCAVFCPTESIGKMLSERLNESGVLANFMSGRDLDLSREGIKVMTLKASKGLEFPIVALAGFGSTSYPYFPDRASLLEREEILARERRTMFVAMTRAMRALVILVPADRENPLLDGFNSELWNLG